MLKRRIGKIVKALILAAGYATRLYPLTLHQPKPLLSVGQRPVIDYLVDKIVETKVFDEILVVTNDKFFAHFESWAKQKQSPLPIGIINDKTKTPEDRLGAIGDLYYVVQQRKIDTALLVLAGDNLFDSSLKGFAELALKKNTVCLGLYDIKDKSLAKGKFGVAELNAEGRVTRLEEKPESPRSSLVAMGVYYFSVKSLKELDTYFSSGKKEDAPGHYVRWCLERGLVFGYPFSGRWFDIGDIESLKKANEIFGQKVK